MKTAAAMPECQRPGKDLTANDILQRCISVYRRNFAACVFAFLVTQAIPVLCLGVWMGLAQFSFPGGFWIRNLGAPIAASLEALRTVWTASFGVAQGVLALLVTADLRGRRISGPEALIAAFALPWRLPAVALLTGLLLYAGIRFGVVLGLVFYVVSYVAIPAAVVEGRGPAGAIIRSCRMVGRSAQRLTALPLRGFERVITLGFLGMLAAGVITIALPAGLRAFAAYAARTPWISSLGVAAALRTPLAMLSIQLAVTLLVYPLFSIAHTVLYYDVRLVHEGFDVGLLTGVEAEGEGAGADRQEDPA